MKRVLKYIILIILLLTIQNTVQAQTTITSAQTGNWSNTATWVGGVVPISGDNVIIASGHTVTLTANTDIGAGNLTVTGTVALAGFDLTAGSLAGAGNIGTSSGTPLVTVGSNGSNTTYSGVYSGTGARLTKEGAGTLTVSGFNSYTGGTNILNGTFKLGANGAIPNTGVVSIESTLDLNGWVEQVEAISSTNPSAVITSSATGSVTLFVVSNNNSSYSGIIQDGSATF